MVVRRMVVVMVVVVVMVMVLWQHAMVVVVMFDLPFRLRLFQLRSPRFSMQRLYTMPLGLTLRWAHGLCIFRILHVVSRSHMHACIILVVTEAVLLCIVWKWDTPRWR